MNQTISVLPKEIMGAVRWAFRARQIPAAYAHPAGWLVLAGSLFHEGAGVAHVVDLLQREQVAARPVELVSEEAGCGVINGRFQDPLFYASQIFDFAASRAQQQGRYLLQIQDVDELPRPFLEALLVQLGERGFAGGVETADGSFAGVVPVATDQCFLTCERGLVGLENGRFSSSSHFSLFCTTDGSPQPLPQEAVAAQIVQREVAWQQASKSGIDVDAGAWATLKKITNEILI